MRTQNARPVRSPLLVLALAGPLIGGCGGGGDADKAGAQPVAPSGGATVAKGAGTKTEGAKPEKKGKGEASAVVALQTGMQLLLRGDPKKAQVELKRATELDPKLSEAFYELGKLEVHLSSQNVGSQARDLDVLDRGIAALDQARALEPDNDQYWFWCGRAWFLRNDPNKAIELMSRAVELNPKHAGAWKALGLAQNGVAKTEDAKVSFQKSIEADPKDSGAHFQLGQVLEVLGDLPNARAEYERSIALNPTEPEVFGRLTQVCGRLGDAEGEARARTGMEQWTEYARKLEKRRRAVNQAPGDAAALMRLGEMYFQVGNWEEALPWFMKSIHINPRDGLVHLYCGIARRHLQDYANAANHLKEAEFLAPDNIEPKLELLRLYVETQDEAGFAELLGKIEPSATEGQDGRTLWDLGEVCQEAGRADEAARLFEKAKGLGVTGPAEDEPVEAAAQSEGK